MARSRTIVIAGAGIGGLTAALTLTRAGFRVVVLEQAARLEEVGAGIQLSPNATHVLRELGLLDRLRPRVVAPEAIRIIKGQTGGDIVRVPLGAEAERRYGAPYWVIHRADLQGVLASAIEQSADVTLRLGTRVEDFAVHQHGVTVQVRTATGAARRTRHRADRRGRIVVHAARAPRRPPDAPRFAHRTAWRAVVPAARVSDEFREPVTGLWLGRDAHLVHYPVKAGSDGQHRRDRARRLAGGGLDRAGQTRRSAAALQAFAPAARTLIALPERWQKWALFDRAPRRPRAQGPVTLLGDAAHPMLPFLAQGGAMAIEDAAVLADCLRAGSNDPRARISHATSTRGPAGVAPRAARGAAQFLGAITRSWPAHSASTRRRCFEWANDGRRKALPRATTGMSWIGTSFPIRTFPKRERMFETTIAGSLPKPSWLAEPNKLWPQWSSQAMSLPPRRPTRRCSR